MKTTIICCLVILSIVVVVNGQSPSDRAKALLQQMTAAEKNSMVHGDNLYSPYIGNVHAIPRLKIPALGLEDGPQGVADGMRLVTAWPCALTVAATFDASLMNQFGAAMAMEHRGKGSNVMLGPMMNIARVPIGGRNFESFGEDPYLSSQMAVASITGIQSQKVIACAKHFVNNNQEYDRMTVSANVDERTQWEIYYPAFQASVNAGVGSVMCGYNKINGVYACENSATLGDLKNKMGFKGWVMSDWGGTHSTVKAALAGLDQEQATFDYFGQALINAVNAGQVPQSRVDDMVLRVLTAMFTAGLFDEQQPTGDPSKDVQSTDHVQLARTLAAAGTVLLKNSRNLLPLSSSLRSIAVIGDDAQNQYIAVGGGSGSVVLPYCVTPLQGIKAAAGNTAVSYSPSGNTGAAQQAAKSADIAIVFVACTSNEGGDRGSLVLPNGQDALVEAIIQAQPNTIVVIHSPGAVLMPWADSASSIVAAFLPGQEDGNAIADVLYGKVNPSARLPVTFPMTDAQTPINTQAQYPGINGQAVYSEGLFVGYRWYDQNKQTPLFPFGHGLSYTTFAYSGLSLSGTNPLTVSVNIANNGKYNGQEVAQLYLTFPASAGEPPLTLRGIKKVTIGAGQTARVVFDQLASRDFSIWDTTKHDWRVIVGQFVVNVGASSRDIRVSGNVNISS